MADLAISQHKFNKIWSINRQIVSEETTVNTQQKKPKKRLSAVEEEADSAGDGGAWRNLASIERSSGRKQNTLVPNPYLNEKCSKKA